jgi:hypothetical protein
LRCTRDLAHRRAARQVELALSELAERPGQGLSSGEGHTGLPYGEDGGQDGAAGREMNTLIVGRAVTGLGAFV